MSIKCETKSPRHARLLVELPASRYRTLSPERRIPQIGDLVMLDQGFTGSDGRPRVLGYFPGLIGTLYEAEIDESELE